MSSDNLVYKRVLLKISGEALMGNQEFGLDPETVNRVAAELKTVYDLGTEMCLVVGGGNIFRGMSGAAKGMDRTTADHMGMLATVMNALALRNALEEQGCDCRVQSAIPMASVCEPYIRNRAIRHLQKGRIVIFAAGTGNPFFTTDSASALRAAEMSCNALLKGTKVDGVYDSDPVKNPDAKRYSELSYLKVLSDDLGVMDHAAISLARESNIPILVFSLVEPGAMARAVQGQGQFTIIKE